MLKCVHLNYFKIKLIYAFYLGLLKFKYISNPWTARRFNQFIRKEISPGCSLEGMMLKLKLQYFGHLMQRVTHWKRLCCWEGLGAGGKGGDRG